MTVQRPEKNWLTRTFAGLRTDNFYAVQACNFALFANLRLGSIPFLAMYGMPVLPKWQYEAPSPSAWLIGVALQGMVPIACGVIAIGCGSVALGRVRSGRVTGGRRRALIGITLGAVGLAIELSYCTVLTVNRYRL